MSALFNAIIRGSIQNRYLVLLGALALVGAGVWIARHERLDALPNFTPPIVIVQAEAPGLGTTEVEKLVTTPLEQTLLGIPDMASIRSTSSPGLSVLQMTFEDDADIFRARQLVSERVVEAKSRLPASLPTPRLAPITAPVGSLLKFCYTAHGNDPNALQALWRFSEWRVRPQLTSIEGVARIAVYGGAEARIEVRPDPTAMVARGITLHDLEQSLRAALSLAPLGRAESGVQQAPVRTDARWPTDRLDPIGNTVITSKDGRPVRVFDVARVVMGEGTPVGAALYDGQPALCLMVEKLPWADTSRLTTEVEAALSELDAQLPAGTVRHEPTFRQSDFIHTSLGALARATVVGGCLVVLILVLFLRSPRLAAISLTALPLSLIAALAVLFVRGVTVNGMVLGGLAIAVGEVVDDAIVDVENIWRRLRENARSASPRPAFAVIHDASAEVRNSVVYASLIVVAVLMPVIIVGGLAGRIFSPLAVTYALAVAASLVVALSVTPALCAILLPRHAARSAGDPETHVTRAMRRAYQPLLAAVARTPGRFVSATVVLGAGAVILLATLEGDFLPQFREDTLIAEVTAWPGTSLEETTRLSGRIDGVLREDGTVPHVASRIGRAALDEDGAPVHRIEMDIVLPKSDDDSERLSDEITERIAKIAGVQFSVEGFLGERINELLSGERTPIAIKLFGRDLDALRAAATDLMPKLAQMEDLESVRSAHLVDVPTIDLKIDEPRLALAGIRRADVVDAAAAWRQGLAVTELAVAEGFTVPLVIAGEAPMRERSRIQDLPVFSASRSAIPLSSLVNIEEGSEPPTIEHERGLRTVVITASARDGALSRAASGIERLMNSTRLPNGVAWALAGQAVERRDAGLRLVLVGGLVLCAVFAFLWMAFGSATDAVAVFAGLPLGLVGGAIAALLLTDGLSMAGLVGFVALCGIMTRNGIMLIAHKNHLIASQPEQNVEAQILAAARERSLPIVMTAATAFFGLLPLAASLGDAGSELESPMAFIVCGGILSSTVLNLVAVPAFLLWFERLRRRRSA